MFLLASCAPMTEQQKYERANRHVLALEKYDRDKADCIKSGGAMIVRKYRATRIPMPYTTWELTHAECVDPRHVIDEIARQSRSRF